METKSSNTEVVKEDEPIHRTSLDDNAGDGKFVVWEDNHTNTSRVEWVADQMVDFFNRGCNQKFFDELTLAKKEAKRRNRNQ